jgi:hypothetical protein
MEELNAVESNRQSEIKKWTDKGVEMQAQRAAREREATEQQVKQSEARIDEILTQLPSDDTVAPFLDAEVARISKAAILGGIKDQKDLVATIVRGIGFRKVLEARQQLIQEKTDAEAAWTKERDELKAQITALEGAQPAGGTTAASTAVAKEGIDEDKIPDNIQSPDALAKWTSGQVKKWTSGR